MRWFNRLTLSRQFLVASFPILLVGMVAIGLWVEREVERGIVTRISEVQSLYVDSLVAPHMAGLFGRETLDASQRAALDALFVDTPLGRKIVAFIIWRPDGRVLYSNEPELIGRQVAVGRGLATALAGDIYTKVIDRTTQQHQYATRDWPERLIETYAPIHAGTLGKVVGAAEFYQNTQELDEAMRGARQRSWGVVALTTLAMYLLLFGLVRRGSRTIVAQREELRERVAELSRVVTANTELTSKVRQAAARTTAINEGFLRRVAADLHDGPAQDLAFAQMRLESMVGHAARDAAPADAARGDLVAVRSAVDLALADLRSICAGMQLPEIEHLSVADVVGRVVRDFERKTGATVAIEHAGTGGRVALPIRITLFRVLQETLANAFRHAGSAAQRVRVVESPDEIAVDVMDSGPGFDVTQVAARTQGGVAGMRERVRSLGGTFEIASAPTGTTVRVRLPARVAEDGHD